MKKLFVVTLSVTTVVLACSKGSNTTFVADCGSDPKSFTTDVSPIIQSFCATNSGCHAAGSNNGPGPLTSYQQIFNARFAIRSAVANGTMPQNSALTSAQKNAILCWIDNGASDN